MRSILALLLGFAAPVAIAGENVLILSGEQAVIEFRFDEPPTTDDGKSINFLAFQVGGSYVDFLGQSMLEQTLRDGAQPLAMRQALRENGMAALFVAEDAPWDGVIMDFDTINDGTIQGMLVVRPVFDGQSQQSRVRFQGRLLTGHVSESGVVTLGPDALIVGCYIEAPVFSDRFETLPEIAQTHPGHRECDFG